MKKYKVVFVLLNLILVLVVINRSIFKKEKTLKEGKLVLLDLAPVDPRSLMQGDYMTLRYDFSRQFLNDSLALRGYAVFLHDSLGVARMQRYQEDKLPLNKSEFVVKASRNRNSLRVGAESYFFEEGQGEKYEGDSYGGLRVDDEGNSILTGLYNAEFNLIE